MTAAWPSGVPQTPLIDGWSWEPYQDPDKTEMERGNTRLRQYPGNNIVRTSFTLFMTVAQYDDFNEWLINDIARGSARFTMDIYDGITTQTDRLCQMLEKPKIGTPVPFRTVGLSLQVFNANV